MVRRGNNRDGSQHDGRGNSYGRDSSSSYGDDSPTRYIPRDEGYRGYNPDADFAGEQPTEYFGGDSSETQFLQRGDETRFENSRGAGSGAGAQGAGAQGSGQYWAPLSEEERDYGQPNQQAGPTQQYVAGGYADPNNGNNRGNNRGDSGNDDSKKGWGKTVAIVAIAAMVAVVALVALVLSFTSGTEDNTNTAEPTQETSSSPTPTATSPEETTTSPLDRVDPSGTINHTRERLEQELNQLRESPPAIPGLGERSSGWGTIPQGVVGKSPASVEVELRTNGYQNVTVVDAEGNQTNSVAAIMGKVASIDPPEGQMAETSTPVTIYLQ